MKNQEVFFGEERERFQFHGKNDKGLKRERERRGRERERREREMKDQTEHATTKKDKKWSRTFPTLFLSAAGVRIYYPALPLYLEREKE